MEGAARRGGLFQLGFAVRGSGPIKTRAATADKKLLICRRISPVRRPAQTESDCTFADVRRGSENRTRNVRIPASDFHNETAGGHIETANVHIRLRCARTRSAIVSTRVSLARK